MRLLMSLMLAASLHAQTNCDLARARPWIDKWLDAWQLTAKDILHINAGPRYDMVLFDATCVYTLSASSGTWQAQPHGGTITLPTGEKVPVRLMSFASGNPKTHRPFFVMAAPSYWQQAGVAKGGDDMTGVFLHEFSHVRQAGGFKIIGEIEKGWKFKDAFDDDVVQSHFGKNEEYVKAFDAERELLFRAATADSIGEVRSLAAEALKMIKARQAHWFTGDEAVFATLDSVWLSMEGSGQWVAYAWLSHPKGGGMSRQATIDKMRGHRGPWSQDEGLALFLVVDRLLPSWPSLVFHEPSIGAVELLERAVQARISVLSDE